MRAQLLILVLLAGLVVSPARADVFKWVDEAGVTHYSNQAPAARKASVVPERISVYKPDPALTRAMSAPPRDRRLDERVELLERQLQQERLYRQEAASREALALQAAYQQCLADRLVDCNEPGFYPGYATPVIVAVRRRVHQPIAPLRPIRGVTAGNVTGAGIMPGNFNGPGAITAGNVVTFAPLASGFSPQRHRR